MGSVLLICGLYFEQQGTWCSGNESARQCRRYKRPRLNPCVRNIPWRRKWQPASVFLPGGFHGQRGLAGYSPGATKSWTSLSDFHFLSFFTQMWVVWDLAKWGWAWMSESVSSCGSGQARACVLNHFSHIRLLVTLWIVTHQALLSVGIFQARILEWVAKPFSRGSSWPRDWTCVSYVCLYWQAGSSPLAPPGKPTMRNWSYRLGSDLLCMCSFILGTSSFHV